MGKSFNKIRTTIFFSLVLCIFCVKQTEALSDTTKPALALGALGDSITVGFNAENNFMDNPSDSWVTGEKLRNNGRMSLFLYLDEYLNQNTSLSYGSVSQFNFAQSGAMATRSSPIDLATQTNSMSSRQLDIVTIEIGANDICSTPFTAASYKNAVQASINLLLNQPHPPKGIVLASIPNIALLPTLPGLAGYCVGIWQSACLNMTALSAQQFSQNITDANSSLAEMAADHPAQVFYDGGAVYNLKFTAGQVASDCFHPNVKGQASMAEAVWNAVKAQLFKTLN